jgi:hypothetical protein
MFNKLSDTGCFTVVIIWGFKPVVEHLEVLFPAPLKATPKKPATLAGLRMLVSRWYQMADRIRR